MTMRKVEIIQPNAPLLTERTKVAVYARVSQEGEMNEHSLKAQVDHYSKLISANPRWENVGIFADYGLTGTDAARPGFQNLIAFCDTGKVDLVLVKSISRFCRNTVDLLNTIRHLKDIGINVRFEKENIDSMSENGELMITLLASLAQEESRSISENTRWAVHKGFERGKVHSVIQYGYDWDGKEFHINEKEAAVVRLMYSLYLEGRSPEQIVIIFKEKGIKSRSGKPFGYHHVWSNLRSEHYKGDSLFQKTYCADFMTHRYETNRGQASRYYAEGTHPQIVSKETWDAVQKEIVRRAELGYQANQSLSFSCFTGKVICGKCGHTYRRRMCGMKKRLTKQYKWICGSKIAGTSAACNAQNIPEKQLYLLTSEVLGCEELTEELFDSQIEKITVTEPSTLTFCMKDGTTIERQWVITTTNTKIREAINGKISNGDSGNAD